MYFLTKDLSVGYGGTPLIEDINISVEKGKILTLIGPNGSGKSTILKSITKHLAKLSGVVYIDGQNLSLLSGRETAQKISVVLTERISPEMMSCYEVVASGRYPYTNHFGKLTPYDREIVEDSLAKVGALSLQERDFMTLSDGQKQRIMLARAICQQPEVIVLDEPTSFLDIKHKIELLDILREMAHRKGITVIMSLHEIDLAHKVSDLVLCVDGDRITQFGPPDEVLTDETINALYHIEEGSYNMLYGSVELSKPFGRAEILVVGGAGTGISCYRALQKKCIPFAAGILFQNDTDYQVAVSLADQVISQSAFCPISPEIFDTALVLLDTVSYVIDTGAPKGELNHYNALLLQAAADKGLPVITEYREFVEEYACRCAVRC